MKKILALILALYAGPAFANTLIPLTGAGRSGTVTVTAAVSYTGPGDVVASAAAWYGLRAYNNTLANSGVSTTAVIDVLGTTTATGCTIYLLGNGTGGLDLTTAGAGGVGNQCLLGATTFCTVTNPTCTIAKIYDQSGNGAHQLQAIGGAQPTLTFTGCGGSLPCMFSGGSQDTNSGASAINVSQPDTMSLVIQATGSGATHTALSCGTATQQTGFHPGTPNAYIFAGSLPTVSASVNTIYAFQGVYQTTTSVIDLNSSATSSLSVGSGNCTSADVSVFDASGGNFFTGYIGEAGIWPVAFSPTQYGNMTTNQRAYWGF